MSAAIQIATDFDGNIVPRPKATSAINRHNPQLFDHLVALSRIDAGTASPGALAVLRFCDHVELGRQLNGQFFGECQAAYD
jgi:hypothetical protein